MLTRALPTLLLTVALAATGCSEESPAAGQDRGADALTCEYPSDPVPASKEVDPPSQTPEHTGDVRATIRLGQGDLRATLDGAGAPCNVNSFVSLAEQGYFDDTTCHRLTVEGLYVLQCGDPTGTGTGGPGYTITDEPTTAEALDPGPQGSVVYPAGTLAMAKTSAPDSAGSQFFIVYEDSPLPPLYTVLGTVDQESTALVRTIARRGTGPDGVAPREPVEISTVTIG